MTTARDIIGASLRIVGAASHGETISGTKLAEGLDALNQMLDGWSAQPNGIYYVTEENFTLTASDGSYTIGNSADLNTTRPIKILNAFVRVSGSDYTLEIITRQEYDKITTKTTTGIPRRLYYEPEMANGKIYLFPEPTTTYELYLKSLKPFTTYTGTDTITLPPGYLEAIKFNLAAKLSLEYGRPITPELAILAGGALQVLKNLNASFRVTAIKSNPFGGRGADFDINSSTYI